MSKQTHNQVPELKETKKKPELETGGKKKTEMKNN
jgi:hypothetical protein